MMKAGTYYIGDLCYVMHGEWDEVCGLIIDDHRCIDGEFELMNGTRFAIFSTKYGDGTYKDGRNREYCVDSGSIGCVPLDRIDQTNEANHVPFGHVVTFAEDFEVSAEDGLIRFGSSVAINTGDDEDDES